MNETVPKSARALGSVGHPALGRKKNPTVTRGVQSALASDKGNTWTSNAESTAEFKTAKRLNITGVASGPLSKSSSASSVSTKRRGGELRWSHGNSHLTSYPKPPIGPTINVVTGLQFHAITRSRNSFEENASETQRMSDKSGPQRKSGRGKMVTEQGHHSERGRAFSKLSREMEPPWHAKRNYLEEGDFVKGRGHRIDTGPMSRPVSGWMNRQSRNAVELAENDKGEGGLGRYYSLDVDTGAVTARQLTNGESILIGVNGKERKQQPNGRKGKEEEEEDGEADELISDEEDSEIVNVESEDTPSLFIPLCWDDQFMTAKVKVVKPRLPSAQPSSDSVNETKPVVFWAKGSQREVAPPSFTKLKTPSKENYMSMALQKKTSQTAKKKQQSVKFHEFLQRCSVSDGEDNLESFRHRSFQSGGTWHTSLFQTPGSENSTKTDLTRSNGLQGDTRVDMIVVGSSQIVSKTSEIEKPVSRVGGAASEKHLSVHYRRGSGGGRDAGSATQREVSIINIVQPIRTKGEWDESGETTEAKKTSERKNDSVVRLRYSVRNPRASTGLRRRHPEGLYKKSPGMARSASMGEGRLAAVSRENSGNDWNLNCIDIRPALHGEAAKDHDDRSTKTWQWSNEDNRPTGSQVGSKEREAIGNGDLSQPFDVVQLSPIRVKTASLQTRSTKLLEKPCTEINNATYEGPSEISSAPPPSRAATPNVRSSSAKSIPILEGEVPSGGDSRRGVTTLHVVPSAAKSQLSECEELQRSPEIEEKEKSLRREYSDGEDAERSSVSFEQRQASELEFGTDVEEMELVMSEEEQIERHSPVV